MLPRPDHDPTRFHATTVAFDSVVARGPQAATHGTRIASTAANLEIVNPQSNPQSAIRNSQSAIRNPLT
jgi:hypothetical protein